MFLNSSGYRTRALVMPLQKGPRSNPWAGGRQRNKVIARLNPGRARPLGRRQEQIEKLAYPCIPGSDEDKASANTTHHQLEGFSPRVRRVLVSLGSGTRFLLFATRVTVLRQCRTRAWT